MTSDPVEAQLAAFFTALRWGDLPEPVRARVDDILVDAIANACSGRSSDELPAVEELVRRLYGDGSSPVVGGRPASPTGAAFLNGFQTTILTMCDVYRPALCHITPEVFPAIVAAGAETEVSLEHFKTSLAVGLEVSARIGRAINYAEFRRQGWHAPGIIGTLGAAAAAAHVKSLSEEDFLAAMGLALSQSSGTFAGLGTLAIKFHQAGGAVAGLLSADFAAAGLGGTRLPVSAPDGGLFSTYTTGADSALLVEGLGIHWELMQISLRRWPASSAMQPLIGLLIDFVSRRNPVPVDRVIVSLPSAAFAMFGSGDYHDELSSRQSAKYITAVVLHTGTCKLDSFSASNRESPRIAELASLVSIVEDSGLPESGIAVEIRSGSELARLRAEQSPGDPAEPLTTEQVDSKLHQVLALIAPRAHGLASDILALVRSGDGTSSSLAQAFSLHPAQ